MPLTFTEPEYKYVGLFIANLLNFAEIDTTDPQLLLSLKAIIEGTYTDGITAITQVDYDEGKGTFIGVFEDKISPKLTKRYKFNISELNISYSPLNQEDIDNFNEKEYDQYLEFARKGSAPRKKECVKGSKCGFTCIRKGAQCAREMSPEQRKAYYAAKKAAAKQRRDSKKINPAAQERVKKAQAAFDSAASDLTKKKQQLELTSKSVNTPAQAATFRRLRDEEIPKAERKLRTAEEDLNKAKREASTGFNAGKPMTRDEVRKPLNDDEKQKAKETLKLAGDARLPLSDSRREKYEEDKAAYLRAKKVIPDLSVAEYKAIRNYTSSGYVGQNGALRGLQKDPNSEQAKQQRLEARVANQALQKAPKFEGEVRRDSRVPSNEFARDYKVGNVIEFKGITSTSSDLKAGATSNYGSQSKTDVAASGKKQESNKASRYEELAEKAGIRALKMEDSTQVEYRIQSRTGRVIKDISVASKESEVALPHGWRGRITKIEDGEGGKKLIHMEEADE